MESPAVPIELSFPVPKAPHAILHAHLTCLKACLMVHLTTSELGESGGGPTPLGSFVYSMPTQGQTKDIATTTLCTAGYSIDYATRLSRILAKKLLIPVYVGCSMNFAGVTSDEELEGLRLVVEKIISKHRETERAAN